MEFAFGRGIKTAARIGYRAGIVIENSIFNGTGVNQFLGCMVNSAHGINTDRDVSTDNTATSIKADNLFNVQHTLKPAHWKNAAWAFHPDAIKQIRKLKDGEGQYPDAVEIFHAGRERIEGAAAAAPAG